MTGMNKEKRLLSDDPLSYTLVLPLLRLLLSETQGRSDF